jgi:hypothetical protein
VPYFALTNSTRRLLQGQIAERFDSRMDTIQVTHSIVAMNNNFQIAIPA